MPTANFCAYVGAAKSEEQRTIWVRVHSENLLLNMEIGAYNPKMLCASLTKFRLSKGWESDDGKSQQYNP